MKRQMVFCSAVCVVMIWMAKDARAQVIDDPSFAGFGGVRAGFHSSTLEEGIRRGQGALIESWGRYNLDTAQAMSEYERWRRRAMDNHVHGVDTYFQAALLNQQYRQAMRGERPTQEDLARYSQMRLPDRLHTSQLDPVFGTIYWPDVLQAPVFEPYRMRMEQIFRDRDSENSGVSSWTAVEVAQLTEAMEEELKRYVSYLIPNDYMMAKNFLRSLAYEARFPPQVGGVARRR